MLSTVKKSDGLSLITRSPISEVASPWRVPTVALTTPPAISERLTRNAPARTGSASYHGDGTQLKRRNFARLEWE
jgi:hypothetical protein